MQSAAVRDIQFLGGIALSTQKKTFWPSLALAVAISEPKPD
ncbi:uncharacterized protein METZ01_LOCUS489724, partial [marine metagenome]